MQICGSERTIKRHVYILVICLHYGQSKKTSAVSYEARFSDDSRIHMDYKKQNVTCSYVTNIWEGTDEYDDDEDKCE